MKATIAKMRAVRRPHLVRVDVRHPGGVSFNGSRSFDVVLVIDGQRCPVEFHIDDARWLRDKINDALAGREVV